MTIIPALKESPHQTRYGTVLLIALVDADNEIVDYGLSFAGTLFVSWPLEAHLFWKATRRLSAAAEPRA